MIQPDKQDRIMSDSSWADGLRGIAALYVAASHLTLCFGRQYVVPCCADDETQTPWLFQRPVFRLIASGHSWVALFFVLLGFVNALKPLKQARAGTSESALLGLSTASFRRSFRLVLPAATATIFSWVLCQIGAYERARNSDAFWLYRNTPEPGASWGQAIEELVRAIFSTWRLKEDNYYDQPQWALVYLLEGSIMAFFVLMATVQLSSVWRMVTITMCIVWSWNWSAMLDDPLVGYTVLGGVVLAEFSLTTYPMTLSKMPLVTTFVVPITTIVSLVLMSVPSTNTEGMPWSANISFIFTALFPQTVRGDTSRLAGSTGALLLCFSILVSPHLRRLLSLAALRWLGKLGFSIYLLHGTFMRTVLAWLVFAGQPTADFEVEIPGEWGGGTAVVARYLQPGPARITIGIALSGAALLYASHLWVNNLEPVFGRITAWAEGKMKRPDSGLLLTTMQDERQDKQG